MTEEKKDSPVPFEQKRMTQAESCEFVEALDLPRDAFAVALDPVLSARVRAFILECVSREELAFTPEREKQARVYWEIGIGRVLGFETYADYLATIPEATPNPDKALFNRLVLAERRLDIVQLTRMLGVAFHLASEEMLSGYRTYPAVEFIWCQDGRRNRGRHVRDCLDTLRDGEIAMTAVEGLCLQAQIPMILEEPDPFAMDLPGTYSIAYPNRSTFLRRDRNHMELGWFRTDTAHLLYGTATRAK